MSLSAIVLTVSAAVFLTSAPEPYIPPSRHHAVISEIENLQRSEGVLAFPGALGYAKHTKGGRGGRVITVDTIDNIVDPDDGFTSLSEAIEVETGPRTIVFAVGGLFDTGELNINMLREAGSHVTVACQTAPSPGVVIRTFGFNIQRGASDIIFRHCAIRLIDAGVPMAESGRSFTIRGGSSNIILDHMSFAWATDENFQAYLSPDQKEGINNITVSNSVVVEGDADSAHPLSLEHEDWFYHAMGPSCNNTNPDVSITNCSIVNNFIAHNSSRNGMIWGSSGELKNNVIYNWYGIGLTVQPHGGPRGGHGVEAIVDNNLMKIGPDTEGATSNRNCGSKEYRCAMYLGVTNDNGTAKYEIGDNYYIPLNGKVKDAERIKHWNADTPDGKPSFEAATDSPVDVQDMAAKGSRFMTCVGASRPQRDAIDARVINEFYDGTGRIGIGENIRTGGHNVNVQRTWDVYGPATYHPDDYDTDRDGMPDAWERAYGLDPDDGSDHTGDKDKDGYTNIEEYLAIAALC